MAYIGNGRSGMVEWKPATVELYGHPGGRSPACQTCPYKQSAPPSYQISNGYGHSVRPLAVHRYGQAGAAAAAGGAAAAGAGSATSSVTGIIICTVVVGVLLTAAVAAAIAVPSILLSTPANQTTPVANDTAPIMTTVSSNVSAQGPVTSAVTSAATSSAATTITTTTA